MNRTASRFALATLAGLATLLLPGASRAQSLQTVETPNYNTSGPQGQIRFKLQGPSSWVGKETFLVCYASVADDDQPWSKTLAAMVGAVARIRKEHDLGANPPKDWTLGITGVTATAPDGDYTVPRTLISKLATEVVWGSNQSHFVRPLQASGALAWPTTGWPSDSGSSMRWGSLTTSTSGVFDSVAVMRRCFTLQVAAWLDNKPETDPTVQAYVDSLMSIFWAEMIQPGTGANFDLNMVAVQIGAGVGGGPPVITLSLPRKVRIQSIGGGLQSRDAYLMLLDAFPINFDTVLRVPYSWNPNSAPPEGDYYFALPTINGYRLEPATLFQGVASVGFECTTPFDISPIPMAPFALYDAATNTYIEMAHDGPDPLVGYLIPTLPTPIY